MAKINTKELINALCTVDNATATDYTRSIGILQKEYEKYVFHTECRPLFSLSELRDPKDNLRRALKCAKYSLIGLNREYFAMTGRHCVGYIKSDAEWENVLLNEAF